MNYIKRHWRGELSLAISFWVNVVLLNVIIKSFEAWFTHTQPIDHPQVAAQFTIIYIAVGLLIIYPWQLVGLWRACIRHKAQTNKTGWAATAQVMAVFSIIATAGNLYKTGPVYKDLYQVGFEKDVYDDYTLELKNDNSVIHLQGTLGFGISREVSKLLDKHPSVTRIVLDSRGGRIYEGRELSKLILAHGLDTYSLTGCYSACTTAFISGNSRYLTPEANLAFHQYHVDYEHLAEHADVAAEEEKDLLIFERQGVAPEFLERLFSARHDDLWYPTKQEMLDAHVINDIVNSSDVMTASSGKSAYDFHAELLGLSAFQSIKRYEPETYQSLIVALDELASKGAGETELQSAIAQHVMALAISTMPQASNEALIGFAKATIDILAKLEQVDPILCLKNLYPDQFGSMNPSAHLSDEEMMPMVDALNLVIVDAHEKETPPLDEYAAEELMQTIVTNLGDAANHLETVGLQSRAQYKQHCDAVIMLYDLILAEDIATAGNGLRYLFSQ
ncbi:hypothetical protein [Nitrincola sp. MINF-07-Sa-05]|uniref:COG3904 family protein n=1 Tax=Nitrincola salilacus TaxID=3400273 RepID=UPI003917E2FE